MADIDLEELEEQVTCWVCFETFVDPVTLTCGHTFCENCAGNIYKKNPSCPFCRKPFGLPLPEVSQSMKDLVKKFHSLQKSEKKSDDDKTDVEQDSPLLWLPKDMVGELMMFLPVEQVGKCSRVCKQLKSYCNDPWIWRHACQRDFPFCSVEKYGNWKHAYLSRRGLKKGWEGGKAGDFDVVSLRGHSNYINVFRLYRGNIVSGSADNSVKIWKANSNKPKHSLVGHSDLVTSLEFNETRLISGAADGQVLSWDTRVGTSVSSVKHGGVIKSLQFDASKVAVGSTSGFVKLYDLRDSKEITTFNSHGSVEQISFDNRKLISRTDSTIQVYDLRMNSHLHDLDHPSGGIPSIFKSVNTSTIVAGNQNGSLHLFDTDTQQATAITGGPSHGVNDLSVDDTYAYAAGTDGSVHVYGLKSHTFQKSLLGHKGPVNTLMGVNGTKVVSGGQDGSIKVWDPIQGKALYSLLSGSLQARSNNPVHPTKPGVSQLEFDESRIVISAASLLKIYDFEVYKGSDMED